jgi:hypothetical protein
VKKRARSALDPFVVRADGVAPDHVPRRMAAAGGHAATIRAMDSKPSSVTDDPKANRTDSP